MAFKLIPSDVHARQQQAIELLRLSVKMARSAELELTYDIHSEGLYACDMSSVKQWSVFDPTTDELSKDDVILTSKLKDRLFAGTKIDDVVMKPTTLECVAVEYKAERGR